MRLLLRVQNTVISGKVPPLVRLRERNKEISWREQTRAVRLAVSAFGGLRRLFPVVAGKVLGEMALSSETACLALYLVSIRDILEEPGLRSIQRLNDNYLDGFGS